MFIARFDYLLTVIFCICLTKVVIKNRNANKLPFYLQIFHIYVAFLLKCLKISLRYVFIIYHISLIYMYMLLKIYNHL